MFNMFGKGAFGRSLFGFDRSVFKRKAARRKADVCSDVEFLEARQVLTVNVAFSGGSLFLTANAGDDPVITFNGGGNNVNLSGATFVGNTSGDFLVTGNIYVTMDSGDNAVTLAGTGTFTGDVTVNLGDGTNSVSVTGSPTLRDLKITGGAGSDTETIQQLSARNISINNGTGDTSVSMATVGPVVATGTVNIANLSSTGAQSAVLGTAANAVTIGNGLTINLGSASTHDVSLTNTHVTGTVSVITGTGTGDTNVTLLDVDATANLSVVNGTVSGAGSDHTVVLGDNLGALSIIGGTVTISNGTAAGGTNSISVNGSTFGLAGKANTLTNLSSTINNVTIGNTLTNTITGSLTVSNTTTGSNNIDLWASSIAGSVSLTNNSDATIATNNTITVGLQSAVGPAAGPVTIAGNLALANGKASGGNGVAISNLTTTGTGNITISNAASSGNDAVLGSFGHNTIAGSVTIANAAIPGAALRTSAIDDSTIGGSVIISHAGTGQSNYFVGLNPILPPTTIGGLLTITDGADDAALLIQNLNLAGKLTYNDAGGGDDSVVIGTNIGTTVEVGGLTNINTGAGNDSIDIGGAVGVGSATFKAFVQLTLGSGDDTLNLTNVVSAVPGSIFGAVNNFQFDGGSGTDIWNISQTTGIFGINPLTAAVSAKLLGFEGPNVALS